MRVAAASDSSFHSSMYLRRNKNSQLSSGSALSVDFVYVSGCGHAVIGLRVVLEFVVDLVSADQVHNFPQDGKSC